MPYPWPGNPEYTGVDLVNHAAVTRDALAKRADPNPYLDLVRKLTEHYEAELGKLDAQQSERDYQNIALSRQLWEIEQYVNSVLYPDEAQPG